MCLRSKNIQWSVLFFFGSLYIFYLGKCVTCGIQWVYPFILSRGWMFARSFVLSLPIYSIAIDRVENNQMKKKTGKNFFITETIKNLFNLTANETERVSSTFADRLSTSQGAEDLWRMIRMQFEHTESLQWRCFQRPVHSVEHICSINAYLHWLHRYRCNHCRTRPLILSYSKIRSSCSVRSGSTAHRINLQCKCARKLKHLSWNLSQ